MVWYGTSTSTVPSATVRRAPMARAKAAINSIRPKLSFQIASAIPNFLIQEYQPVMFNAFNEWLRTPLSVEEGQLVVPKGAGLGLDIDEERFRRDVDASVTIEV